MLGRYKGVLRGTAPFLFLLLACTPAKRGDSAQHQRTATKPKLRGTAAQQSPNADGERPADTNGALRAAKRVAAKKAEVSVTPLAAGVCTTAAGLPRVAPPTLTASLAPSKQNLQSWVELLAGPGLRGRQAGTRDSKRAAALIAEQFRELGAKAPRSDGYCVPFSNAQLSDQNVVAHISAPKPECPWVVVGAHYDALGTDKNGVMYPGADDNASGVAVLMELARLIQAGTVTPDVGVVLAAFGGEETDLAGSRAYVQSPTVPLSKVSMMINVDMAGRKPAGYPIIGYEAYGKGRARSSRRVRMAAAKAKVRTVAAQLGDRSDSSSFSPHVPAVFFCTMVHADYHKPTDVPERVDYAQTTRTLKLVTAMVESLPCSINANL